MILFILSSIYYFAAKGLDVYSSLDFKYYGAEEGMPLFRDKNGDLSLKMVYIVFGAIYVVSIVLYILMGWYAIVLLIPTATASLIAGLSNFRKQKARRRDQIAQLALFYPGSPHLTALNMTTRNGKTFYSKFRWLDSDNPNRNEAIGEVWVKLVEFAKNPQFPA